MTTATLDAPVVSRFPVGNSTAAESHAPAGTGITQPQAKPARPWIFNRWLDLFLVCNLVWPVVVLAILFGGPTTSEPLSFLQVYFLSTPHRWITLVLVFGDKDIFWKQKAKFGILTTLLLGLGFALYGVGVAFPMGATALVPLMMLDYVWNSWHFAAQHAGIARIYGRSTRPEMTPAQAEFEKSAIRTLVLWVFFRLAIHVAAHAPEAGYSFALQAERFLGWFDPVALIPVCWLIYRELRQWKSAMVGRIIYLFSVTILYTGQLLAIRFQSSQWMLPLFIAGAMFHATEYLAICGWSMKKKQGAVWKYLAPRIAVSIAVFMLALGVTHYVVESRAAYFWAFLTLLVSLLHYGYDGVIWKSRPAKATVAVPSV